MGNVQLLENVYISANGDVELSLDLDSEFVILSFTELLRRSFHEIVYEWPSAVLK